MDPVVRPRAGIVACGRASLLVCLLFVLSEPAHAGEAPRPGPIRNACAGAIEPDYWVRRLTAADSGTRARAASALGEMRARAAVPALVRALDDTDPRVRRAVVEALGRFGPDAKAAVPALTRALSDGNAEIRVSAQRTLERIGAR